MKSKIVGLVGYTKKEVLFFKKKYKNFHFKIIEDKNFFSKEALNINALVVLYEFPVKNTLSIFLRKKFNLFKKLEWLHLTRAGIDECIPYMKNYNFKFTAGKKIQGPNVSEHCISLLLALTRGLFSLDRKQNFLRPTEIRDKKVLITGYGGIGQEIAKKINAFGAEVHSVNDTKVKSKYIKKNYYLRDVKKIIKNFDIVINSMPLTSKTKKFYNKKIFNKMKDKSFFINISRDQTINIADLKLFIRKKKFSGVGIDNTGSFKMRNKIFYDHNSNFLLTDHQAGVSTNLLRRKNLIIKNLYNYHNGNKLNYLVSKEKEY